MDASSCISPYVPYVHRYIQIVYRSLHDLSIASVFLPHARLHGCLHKVECSSISLSCTSSTAACITNLNARFLLLSLVPILGPQVHGFACDVSSADAVQALDAAAATALGGHVDVWVNNAAFSGTYKPFMELEPEQIGEVRDWGRRY